MKFRLLLILLSIVITTSCKKEDSEVVKSLSVNINSLELISEGGETKIIVEANTKWNARSSQDWLKITPNNGNGNAEILAQFEPNKSKISRVAEVLISADGVSQKTIVVTQLSYGTLERPTNVSADFSENENVVSITWNKVTGAESYRVYYSASENGTYELLREVLEAKLTDPIRNRYYKIKAIKGEIESELSDFVLDSPKPPTVLSAQYETPGTGVRITWNSVSDATRYRVYSSSSLTQPFKLIAETSQTTLLDNNRYAYYKIASVRNTIEGKLSDYTIETPYAPNNMVALYNQSQNVVNISWGNVPIATGYKVYYSETLTGEYKLLAEVNGSSSTDVNRNRYYKVSAINKGGESGFRYKFSEKGRENAREQLVDIEGNVYKTVQIGNQIWMAENLRVTKTSAGVDIPLIIGDNAWKALTSASIAYSFYDNSKDVALSKNYGALYTWEAAKAACPKGWHLPSSEEWRTLMNYVRDNVSDGDVNSALKSTTGWRSNPGTDDYGFAAVGAGNRYMIQGTTIVSFNFSEFNTYWWGSSIMSNEAFSIGSYYTNGTINNSYYVPKNRGFSVRYIKD